MIERWQLRSAPSQRDPLRFGLRLTADPASLLTLVRELGAGCGRPRPERAPFTHEIFLEGLTPPKQERVRQLLSKHSPKGESPLENGVPAAMTAEPVKPAQAQPLPSAPPAPSPAAPPAMPQAAPPASQPAPKPAPAVPPSPSPAPVPIPKAAPVEPPKPSPAEPPKPAPAPAPKIQPLPSPAAPQAAPPKVEPPKTEPPKPAAVEPPKAAAPAPAPAAAAAHAAPPDTPPTWTVEWNLWPDKTFETLQIGAHNRFAHAAAMSVVGHVGTMYNPLAVFGGPSCGRSHTINAIAVKVAEDKQNGGPVIRTTGIRLALAAAREGAEFGKRFQTIRAIFVDDLDLLHVFDANRAHVSKAFAPFLTGGRQLVVGTAMPPKMMGGWEVPLGFAFSQGWSVELKPPGPAAFRTILTQMVTSSGLNLSEVEAGALGEKSAASLPAFAAWLRRLSAVRKAGSNEPFPALIAALDLPPEPSPLAADTKSDFKWEAPSGARLGLFFPEGAEGLARAVASKASAAAPKLGMQLAYSEAVAKAYDPAKPSSFFDIADTASRYLLAGALVFGSSPETPTGKNGEFGHAVERALVSIGVKTAFVPWNFADAEATPARAAADLAWLPA
jgi:hypothetical protein